MEKINFEHATRLLMEAMNEYGGDHVYEKPAGAGCSYVHGFTIHHVDVLDAEGNSVGYSTPVQVWASEADMVPGCLVGKVYSLANVPLTVMSTKDVNSGAGASLLALKLEKAGVIATTRKASALLSEVQNRQDDGESWGEAIARSLALFVTSAYFRDQDDDVTRLEWEKKADSNEE